MKLMKIKMLQKMMIGVAIIGMGFLTGCSTISCDVHDPQLANDPFYFALIKDPSPMQYGRYFNEALFTFIFIRHYDGCGNCLGINIMEIQWTPGHLEHPKFVCNFPKCIFNEVTGLDYQLDRTEILRSRMNSSFHKPIELRLGNKQWWIVYSIAPVVAKSPAGARSPYMIEVPLKWNHNLEFFNENPSLAQNATDMPVLMWWLGSGSLQNCPWRYPATLYECDRVIYRVQTIKFGSDGRMTDLQVAAWTPTIEDVLDGISCLRVDRESASGESAVKMEKNLNTIMIEWKTKELPGIIAKADAAQLKDMVIKLEKAVLSLDADASVIKAAIDEAKSFVPDPRDKDIQAPPAPVRGEEIAKLMDQRKALLANILTLLKKTLQSKG